MAEIQDYLLSVPPVPESTRWPPRSSTVLPGAEEVLALLEVRDQARSGRWDLVVVDCAPTAETLRLLALPDALGWYMERVFPPSAASCAASARARPMAGVPMPHDRFDAVERLHAELREVRGVLTAPEARYGWC